MEQWNIYFFDTNLGHLLNNIDKQYPYISDNCET